MSTEHPTELYLSNESRNVFEWVTIAHANGDLRSCKVWTNVGPGSPSDSMSFIFTTGDDSDDDYWYITFAHQGVCYKVGSTRCDWIREDVGGGPGYMRIRSLDEIVLVPPVSASATSGTVREP